jgi:hypothetical protein
MTSGTTVISYLRCSTSDQAEYGAGLGAQRASIEDHWQKRGWQVSTGLRTTPRESRSVVAPLSPRQSRSLSAAKRRRSSWRSSTV